MRFFSFLLTIFWRFMSVAFIFHLVVDNTQWREEEERKSVNEHNEMNGHKSVVFIIVNYQFSYYALKIAMMVKKKTYQYGSF